MTSCIGKLVERVIKNRLEAYLENENKIVWQQSGFRSNRSCQDNLLFLTQKASEAMNRKKNCLAMFFDISKAFDKVWHEGLLLKMHNLNLPLYLVLWVKNFLQNRVFKVKLNGVFSEPKLLLAGVPQGSVISPILFSIFINDIPLLFSRQTCYSLLFADDLVTLYCFKKPGKMLAVMKKYLKDLENWLYKWKMKMSGSKCSYIIFSNSTKEFRFNFEMSDSQIPYEKNPVFLGIKFDKSLSFKPHCVDIRNKCMKRLNILKIISHSSWKLKKKTLIATFYALIRSIIDYFSFSIHIISPSNLDFLQVIQNRAIKIIFKTPILTNLGNFAAAKNIICIKYRLANLFKKYFMKNVLSKNPLLMHLCDEFKTGFESRQESCTPLSIVSEEIFQMDFNQTNESQYLSLSPLQSLSIHID